MFVKSLLKNVIVMAEFMMTTDVFVTSQKIPHWRSCHAVFLGGDSSEMREALGKAKGNLNVILKECK